MPITSVDGWSTTANLNSDVNGNNIAENCSPAGINNAMREMMAQIAATPLAETAATMRTNLGLVIGTDVQAYDTDLAAIAALVSAANKIAYATGAGTWALSDFSAYGRSLVDDADAAAARTTLGLGTIATAASTAYVPTGTDTSGFAVGVSVVTADDGTQSSGTYTPSYVGGNLKRIINGGAFTLAAPSASGGYTLVIQITNNGSAGAITLSGFSKSYGDSFTTTDGHDFIVYITKINGFISSHTQALQ